jgi:hypothetical protein
MAHRKIKLHLTKSKCYQTVYVLWLMFVVPAIEKYRSGGPRVEAAGGVVSRVESVKTRLKAWRAGAGLSSQIHISHK